MNRHGCSKGAILNEDGSIGEKEEKHKQRFNTVIECLSKTRSKDRLLATEEAQKLKQDEEGNKEVQEVSAEKIEL